MAYVRVNWQDGPLGGTPLSAANLNIMDKGIADLDAALTGLDAALTAHKSSGDHDNRYPRRMAGAGRIWVQSSTPSGASEGDIWIRL